MTPDKARTATPSHSGSVGLPEASTIAPSKTVTKTWRIRLKWNAPSARIASEARMPVVAQQVAVPSAASSWIGKAILFPAGASGCMRMAPLQAQGFFRLGSREIFLAGAAGK